MSCEGKNGQFRYRKSKFRILKESFVWHLLAVNVFDPPEILPPFLFEAHHDVWLGDAEGASRKLSAVQESLIHQIEMSPPETARECQIHETSTTLLEG